jgi:hypothetical protein
MFAVDAHNRPMFSDEEKTFLRVAIRSMWALELLLFLRKHEGRAWTVDALTRELRASPSLVNEVLSTFRMASLIAEDEAGAVRYSPASEPLKNIVDQVARDHATRPLAVMKEIYSADARKIQDFADAFKLRKD